MVKIPIELRLRKESLKNIARAQDIIVEELFKIFDNAVLHGGTGIWRCYNGNRFSEDVDAYIPRDLDKIERFFETLNKEGFVIKKRKISENSLFSNLKFKNVYVKFEALFKIVKGELKDYETSQGSFNTINCLSAEALVKEKISAYLSRFKIRDMYDIFFLLKYVENKKKIKKEMDNLINNFKKAVDERNLSALILEGIVPKSEEMLNYIKRETK